MSLRSVGEGRPVSNPQQQQPPVNCLQWLTDLVLSIIRFITSCCSWSNHPSLDLRDLADTGPLEQGDSYYTVSKKGMHHIHGDIQRGGGIDMRIDYAISKTGNITDKDWREKILTDVSQGLCYTTCNEVIQEAVPLLPDPTRYPPTLKYYIRVTLSERTSNDPPIVHVWQNIHPRQR